MQMTPQKDTTERDQTEGAAPKAPALQRDWRDYVLPVGFLVCIIGCVVIAALTATSSAIPMLDAVSSTLQNEPAPQPSGQP